MRRFLIVAAAFLIMSGSASADVEVRTLTPGAASPAATVEQLAWLEGTWIGQGLGGETVEAYSPPLAGTIVGYFRFVKDGKPVFYEIVTFVEEGGSVLMRLKHFHPNLVGWEEKDKSQEFKLVAIEGQAAYFDGQTVKREGDTLYSAVRIRARDGTSRVEQFSYKLRK
jgi:hypothetical protein